MNIYCQHDNIQGLNGNGLSVLQQDGINSQNLNLIWKPEKFACYRDGKYLGIWDPLIKKLSPIPENLDNVEWLPDNTIPQDFDFIELINAQQGIDLLTIKPAKGKGYMVADFIDNNGNQINFKTKGGDAIIGLNGRGLSIEQKSEGQLGMEGFHMHMMWTPEPFACYRNNKLLGIWEPSRRKIRLSRAKAEASIELIW